MNAVEVKLRVPGRDAPLRLLGGEDERSLLERIAARDGSYERGVVRLLRRLVHPEDVILDAGAHIGVIAMTMAVMAPRGTVHALEASPRTAAQLQSNADANGLDNIRVHLTAVAATPGSVRFTSNGGFSAGSHVGGEGELALPATSLDAWVAANGVTRLDLVKADIEGSELALLEGGANTLSTMRPTLVMEVNPAALRRVDGRGPRELWRLLTNLYPRICWIGRGGALVPLHSEEHLLAQLRRHGLGDVVCSSRAIPHGGWPAMAGRILETIPHRGPEYAVEPALRLRPLGPVPVRMHPGARSLLPVDIGNWSGSRLESRGRNPVRAAVRWWDADGRVVVDGSRAPLRGALRPGGTRRVAVELAAPTAPGTYMVAVALVQDGYAWLDDLGPESAIRFPVVVEDAA